jgi:hypothetical protein
MMNLLRFHGLELSEELCLGIGGGLGFTYLRGMNVRLYLVFGRSDDLELNLARALGMYMALESHPDPARAWQDVVGELTTTGPVLLDTDVSRMPHTADSLSWPSVGSHGGHKVVVTGWNPRTQEVELCDYLWARPRRLPLRSLWNAWMSDSGPLMRTHNFWYRLVPPGHFPELPEAVRQGIRTNLFRMTQPWNKFFGLGALQAFLRGVTGWRFALPPERRMAQAYATYVSLELGGTGKGNFRRMYARFLLEAGALTGDRELGRLSLAYRELGSEWSALAELLRRASLDPGGGVFADDPAPEALAARIWAGESAALERLQTVAARWA